MKIPFPIFMAVLSLKDTNGQCSRYYCYETGYARFNVQTNDTIIIKAEYVANYSSGGFSQCLEIYSEGLINGSDGNFNASCENPQENKLNISKPLRTSPYIISSVGNNDNDDVITTTSHVTNNPTDSTLKESSNINQEKQICKSTQVPVGIFIAITVLSAIFNIFFFFRLKSRKPLGTHSNNRNTMTNQTTGHRNQTGAYAELNVGVMATGETTDTENQYDALKHRDNYLTMKTIGNKGGTKTSECKDCYINMNYV